MAPDIAFIIYHNELLLLEGLLFCFVLFYDNVGPCCPFLPCIHILFISSKIGYLLYIIGVPEARSKAILQVRMMSRLKRYARCDPRSKTDVQTVPCMM